MSRIAHCACGALRVVVSSEPILVSVCHCYACKRQTGSAFSWNAVFARKAVEISGEEQCFDRTGDEGSVIRIHTCTCCFGTVYFENNQRPEVIMVQAGCFADETFLAPTWSVYHDTDRRCAWVEIATKPLETF